MVIKTKYKIGDIFRYVRVTKHRDVVHSELETAMIDEIMIDVDCELKVGVTYLLRTGRSTVIADAKLLTKLRTLYG